MEKKIDEIVNSLLDGIQGMSKSETIVGEPQQAGDATVLPIHRLKVTFGVGGAEAGAHGKSAGGDSGGHGAGGALELDPVGAIAVSKDGHASLLPVDADEGAAAWMAWFSEMPDMVGKLTRVLGERVTEKLDAKLKAEAKPAEAKAALPDKAGKS